MKVSKWYNMGKAGKYGLMVQNTMEYGSMDCNKDLVFNNGLKVILAILENGSKD